MPELSEHTRLINLLICLSHRTPDLPHRLDDLGYSLDHIGLKIVFPDGKGLNPDITFKSHAKNHLLIVDAKSGGVNDEQATKYKSLTPDDISRMALTTLPASRLTIQVCYVCDSKNKTKVLESEKLNHWGFPILVFEDNTLRKETSSKSFQDKDLEKLFAQGITLDREPSTFNYPFGEGDSMGWIAYEVLIQLARFKGMGKNSFTEEELMRDCHPLLEYMDKEQRAFIHRVVHNVLETLNQRSSKSLIIKKVKGQEWEIVAFTPNKPVQGFLMSIADEFDARPPPVKHMNLKEFFGTSKED